MQATNFFPFNEEQLSFKKQIDRFVDKEVRPYARQWDEEDRCPKEIFGKLVAIDALAVGFPEEYGGAGGMVEQLLLIESLASISAGAALSVYVHTTMACSVLNQLGNRSQKEQYLAPALKGKKLGCFAYAEPNAGADVTAVECQAKSDGEYFVLNGSKLYITNGPFADFVVLVARTDNQPGLKGISLIIVDQNTPGFSRKPLKKMGLRGSEMAELYFDNCKVHKSQLLGPLHNGLRGAIQMFTQGRSIAAAFSCGMAGEALQQAINHVSNRLNKGRPLSDYQFIKFTLADMKTRLEAARLMTFSAARLIDEGKPYSHECSLAKLYATEANTWICERAFHLHGVQGYMMESDVQRFYRDCKVWEFGEGTSEMQREMIAAEILAAA